MSKWIIFVFHHKVHASPRTSGLLYPQEHVGPTSGRLETGTGMSLA